jgi:uncharacterized protein (DUF924 family)
MTADEIINFWLDAGRERWFGKSDPFDAEIRDRFGDQLALAKTGAYDDWSQTPRGLAALVIMFDQFSRNIHRNSAKAFDCDAKALDLAKHGIARGDHLLLPATISQWLFMPFEHSEVLSDQQTAVRLFEEQGNEDMLKWAKLHRDIIMRFGRFPHRNALLGRISTAEEIKFLQEGGFAG